MPNKPLFYLLCNFVCSVSNIFFNDPGKAVISIYKPASTLFLSEKHTKQKQCNSVCIVLSPPRVSDVCL